ncbi:MFS transporter [Paraburkholderia sediminicola]|uniref:MFS transporter n=1 Tax=Paraburkholderia sediminicola TaxID=458836 RepID=UPI000FEFA05D
MSNKSIIDVKDYIEQQKVSSFSLLIFALCFAVVVLDGYDTVAIGYVAQPIVDNWKVSREALAPVMSAALVGLGLGAFLGGPLADRFGRRLLIVGSTAVFGLFSGLSSVAPNIETLMLLRLLTGLGLGAAMPNSVALMSEFAPKRVRSLMVNSQLMGFTAGSAVAGAAAAWLLPQFGWQSVFLAGGIAPAFLVPILFGFLPESAQFMVLKNPSDPRILRILRKLSRSDLPPDALFGLANGNSIKSRKNWNFKEQCRHIFSIEYRTSTVLLWIVYFMNLTIWYLLAGWLPTLLRDAGFSLQRAAAVSSILPIGGCIGTVLVGFVMDRFNAKRVVGWLYITVAAMTPIIGQALGMPALLGVLLFLVGAMIASAGISVSSIAAQCYGSECRSTGVSWMYAVGRFGGVFGMFVGASLAGRGWRLASVFDILAVPSIIAGVSLLILARSALSSRNRPMDLRVQPLHECKGHGEDNPYDHKIFVEKR